MKPRYVLCKNNLCSWPLFYSIQWKVREVRFPSLHDNRKGGKDERTISQAKR